MHTDESVKVLFHTASIKKYLHLFQIGSNMNHFYFLLPISRESIVFGSNFRNGDFKGFTRFQVP